MIDIEMKILIDELRADIAAFKLDITLMSHNITKIREQLEQPQQPNPVGIVPVPPPTIELL